MSEPRSRDGGRYECECERVRATDTGLATATAVNTWKARTTLGFMGKLRQRPGVGLGWAVQGSKVIPEVQLRRRP